MLEVEAVFRYMSASCAMSKIALRLLLSILILGPATVYAEGFAVEDIWAFTSLGGFCLALVFAFRLANRIAIKQQKAFNEAEKREIEALRRRLRIVMWPHRETLIRKFYQKTYRDDYGRLITSDWEAEKVYYLTNVLGLHEEDLDYSLAELNILDFLEEGSTEQEINAIDASINEPLEFERYCAQTLADCGWETQLTRNSGDQGVDIIAQKGGQRVVVQCKLYSNPVGNSAVQEAIAGKVFENAHFAVVVTNNTYTKAARQLAHTGGVLLLHYEQLPEMKDKLGIK